MSCNIQAFADLYDIDSLKTYLFTGDHNSDWGSSSWEWPDEDAHHQHNENKEKAWLQECKISLSSTGEVLVVAHKNAMVILTAKWDSQAEGDAKTRFHISWHGNPCEERNELITSVACVPLISQKRSSHCGPDWTCIIVGFSSGYVRFFAETSDRLISELLHDEPVLHVKCQSHGAPRHAASPEQAEEVHVVYPSAICIVPGFGLFQTLRACRNQLARVQANCGDSLRAPPLACRKLGFADQDRVSDCEVAGPATAATFDHLQTASVCGGFGAWCRSSAPRSTVVVAAGSRPFVGFHHAVEGEAPPVLADMAKALASRIKSTIPGWLLPLRKSSSMDKVKEKVQVDPVENTACRFGVCDIMRHGNRIVMSPGRNLSVVSDSLGRVILIDNKRGVAIRMWKGYREAQCGWLEAQEDVKGLRSSGDRSHRSAPVVPRVALFLVIYSPKKGIIEIWTMQQGPKIATFSASKSGRLLYTSYGLMGLNNNPINGGNRSARPCVFVDPSGTIMDIQVPFHFALSDRHSQRARDAHLLKRLKASVREAERDEGQLADEVRRTVRDLRTSEGRLQTLEFLCASRHSAPEAVQAAVDVCKERLADVDMESLDYNSRSLLFVVQKLQQLVALYQFLHRQNQQPPDYNTVVPAEKPTPLHMSSVLNAPERQMERLLEVMDVISSICENSKPSNPEARVAFADDETSSLSDFLSSFDLEGLSHTSTTTGTINTIAEYQPVFLRKDITEDKLTRVGELLFRGVLCSEGDVQEWRAATAASRVEPRDLARLAVAFWLNRREGAALLAEMARFSQLLHAICTLAGTGRVCADYGEVSQWWQPVRAQLADSSNPFRALTGAMICCAVARRMGDSRELDQGAGDPQKAAGEWENMSQDVCQWMLLIGQLEDVALLDAFLRQRPHVTGEKKTRIKTFWLTYEKLAVSLSNILKNGKGSVSELVARWVSYSGIEPQYLVDRSDQEFCAEAGEKASEEPSDGRSPARGVAVERCSEAVNLEDSHAQTLELVGLLKKHFPYSLTSSVLLANLGWEYLLSWQRNTELILEALEAAVSCLRTVPSPHMRQGVCSLAWSMHLGQRFESAARLMHKVGKVPKERLCRQEVGISDLELTAFLRSCVTFLDIFMEASLQCDACRPADFSRWEELWQGEGEGAPPLSALALAQPPPSYDLLHLHHQLASALLMMAAFHLRLPRPVSALFDSTSQAALFSDLASNPQLPGHCLDQKLNETRLDFLFRVIAGATQSIQRIADSADDRACSADVQSAVEWTGRCLELAAAWHIGPDALRRHQICELYSCGHDRLAEEIIPAVSDTATVGSQLLMIVGQRVKRMIMSSSNLHHKIAQLSPLLSSWMESLDEGALHSDSRPLADTAQLLGHVVRLLPEGHRDHQLAQHMLEALHALQDSL
ncbi:rab3 GTPase-activating protein non-catalytic subunit isoform X2 [Bacillus rossius redtenbacheri]|uniref:rab3 GTPase-activating protein non-catalytic subunit isoform X2 n=1 Tax=Bacillus rossius redtenbacheri TaxID=93214 RepID=UPI002FDCCF71